MKKDPRWVVAFVRALERTGEARAAALDAGIDHSTAYARRRAHGGFAAAWQGALAAHAARVKTEQDAEVEALRHDPSTIASPSIGSRPRPASRVEPTFMARGQVKRVGPGRWSQAKEAIFFEELAATANATRAAAAAGVSPNAVFARRLKHLLFAAKWTAVVRTAKASIDLYLVEETRKTFDPDALDTGNVEPKVTIAEAIRIAQLNGGAKGGGERSEAAGNPFQEQADAMGPEEVDALRAKLVRKLRRLRDRDMPGMIAQGWSFDEAYDQMVPPGWVRG